MSFISTLVSEINRTLVVLVNASPTALLALVALFAFATICFCVHKITKSHSRRDDS